MTELLLWVENNTAIAYWAQGLAILLTGICAVIAGFCALRGAHIQAIALQETQQKEHERIIRTENSVLEGYAAALAAELQVKVIETLNVRMHAVELRDQAIHNRSQHFDINEQFHYIGSMEVIRKNLNFLKLLVDNTPLSGEIYTHDPTVVAKFGNSLAIPIVQAYADFKYVFRANSDIIHAWYDSLGSDDIANAEAIISNCNAVIEPTRKTIQTLIEVSNVSDTDRRKLKEWLQTIAEGSPNSGEIN